MVLFQFYLDADFTIYYGNSSYVAEIKTSDEKILNLLKN